MRASLLQPCASCSSLTAPELVRPLPVKAKFRSGAGDFAIATWCYLVVACLGGLFYAPGWFGPSLWRSSSDLGPWALHYHVVAERFADCLTGAGVARVSPAGDCMLVWCVGTCPHAAHRQSFVDGLITWIAHPPHLRVCCIIVPLAVATLPTQPYNVASCTSSNRVLLAVRLAWHLCLHCPVSAMQHPCAVYSCMLAMRKSCKMDTVGPPTTTLLAAYIVPPAVWLVWMAEFYGLPLKAQSVSFCLHKMALADVYVAGLCSHRQARQPLRLFAFTRTWRSSRWRFWELRY